jgi:hypothetical protein
LVYRAAVRPQKSMSKIHVLTDILGRPAVIRLTPGNVSDVRIADELIEAAGSVRVYRRSWLRRQTLTQTSDPAR